MHQKKKKLSDDEQMVAFRSPGSVVVPWSLMRLWKKVCHEHRTTVFWNFDKLQNGNEVLNLDAVVLSFKRGK